MSRISTPLFHERSVNGLLDQQAKLSELQLQISTGKKVSKPSDDPIGSSRLLNLKQQESETNQYQSNISAAQFDLSSEEVQLKDVLLQLSKLRELTIQAGDGSLSASNLKSVKLQIEGIRDQIMDIANSNVDGEYMFAGSKVTIKPVERDAQGNYNYLGDELQRQAQIGPSIEVSINDTAKNLFFQLPTDDINVLQASGHVNLTSTQPGLVAMTSGLQSLDSNNELIINGIGIRATTAADDTLSPTADATKSAIASAAAINASSGKHGVVATVNSNQFDFTGGTYTTNALAAGDLTINGIQIVGSAATADAQGLADLINNTNPGGVDGVVASVSGGQVRLTAADGRNIQLQYDGTTTSGISFTNFDMTGGALNQVQRSTVTLNNHEAITITGSSPSDVGFTAGTTSVSANSGNAVVSNYAVVEPRPQTASNIEKYLVRFSSATEYSIYKESDPFTPVTNFKVYGSDQDIDDAELVESSPANFSDGDTIVIDGVQFTISGTPATDDVFTIELEPLGNQNIFTATQNLLDAISNYSTQPQRLSYEIGLALTNIEHAENRVSEVRSQIGARLSLVDNQERSNDEFIFFAKQGISRIEDLDMVSAISELVQQQTSFEAAQRSIVQIQRLTLFDFI